MSEAVYKKRIKEMVTRDIVTLNSNDTIHDALSLMSENRVSALPVVDNRNRCVGILSAADLVDLTRETDDRLRDFDCVDLSTKKFLVNNLSRSLGDELVQTFMSDSVVTVSLETPIGRAAQEMLRNHIHHLPVVDIENRLLGIVSTMDLLGEFADAAPD